MVSCCSVCPQHTHVCYGKFGSWVRNSEEKWAECPSLYRISEEQKQIYTQVLDRTAGALTDWQKKEKRGKTVCVSATMSRLRYKLLPIMICLRVCKMSQEMFLRKDNGMRINSCCVWCDQTECTEEKSKARWKNTELGYPVTKQKIPDIHQMRICCRTAALCHFLPDVFWVQHSAGLWSRETSVVPR